MHGSMSLGFGMWFNGIGIGGGIFWSFMGSGGGMSKDFDSEIELGPINGTLFGPIGGPLLLGPKFGPFGPNGGWGPKLGPFGPNGGFNEFGGISELGGPLGPDI